MQNALRTQLLSLSQREHSSNPDALTAAMVLGCAQPIVPNEVVTTMNYQHHAAPHTARTCNAEQAVVAAAPPSPVSEEQVKTSPVASRGGSLPCSQPRSPCSSSVGRRSSRSGRSRSRRRRSRRSHSKRRREAYSRKRNGSSNSSRSRRRSRSRHRRGRSCRNRRARSSRRRRSRSNSHVSQTSKADAPEHTKRPTRKKGGNKSAGPPLNKEER